MVILNGKDAAQSIKNDLKKEIDHYKDRFNIQPKLAIIQVGEDKASDIYIRNKIKSSNEVGIKTTLSKYSESSTEEEILKAIKFFNDDDYTDGIIVQTPLPDHISYKNIIRTISPKKDVDGFHSDNMGRMCLDLPGIKPATALGVLKILEYYNINWEGKNVTVVGRGQHVGLPIAIMLGNKDKATVTSCHINTSDLKEKTINADIIICAVGKQNMITEDMVKEGSVIVDVGINRNNEGKLCGDVDYNNLKHKVSAMTPVPNGVGPMTVASLLLNVLHAFKEKL